MEQQQLRGMPRAEPATTGTVQGTERVNVYTSPRGASSTPGALRETLSPSEGSTVEYVYEWAASKAEKLQQYQPTSFEDDARRRVPQEGSKTPQQGASSKTGEASGNGPANPDRDEEETLSASESARWESEERHRRRIVHEREHLKLDIAEAQTGETAIAQPPNTLGRKEKEFQEWVRDMENSMRQPIRDKDGRSRGQHPVVQHPDARITRTPNPHTIQYGHDMYATQQDAGYATHMHPQPALSRDFYVYLSFFSF
ncbi:uncharacterized protein LOC120897552 [Anopheles arabiensis]|uniref:uncharacterized protein LOC120897552 n=1 Tax=Anopheles arabiensis TaxID=7173 RepID=UPI001AADD820|nr:uncharacterized protein LOC120897552 [Anopheles arabiensis]